MGRPRRWLIMTASGLTGCLADNPDYIPPPSEVTESATGSSGASSTVAETDTDVSTSSAGTATSTASASSTEPTSSMSAGTTGACVLGEIHCVDGDAEACVDGESIEITECAGECADGIGCTPCSDGAIACDGDLVRFCDGGEYFVGDACDPIQGLACVADVGCAGPCSEDELFSLPHLDLGCDFYAMVTPSSVVGGTLAVTVEAGPDGATITWSHDDQIDGTKDLGPYESVAIPDFAWEPKLGTLTPATAMGAKVAAAARRVRSDRPVRVSQFSGIATDTSSGATSLWPTTSWDFAAPVAHWGGDPLQDLAWVAVTASWEQTLITLQLPPEKDIRLGSGFAEDGSGQVVIDPGDVLLILAQPGVDLTAAKVTGDGPIQVLAGNHCAAIGGAPACDHLEESMPTVDAAGTTFAIGPALDDKYLPRPSLVRVLAISDGTLVETDPLNDPVVIDEGYYVEYPALSPMIVHTNQPVHVFQYVADQPGGDEAFTWVVPFEHWIDDASALVPGPLGQSALLLIHEPNTTLTVDNLATSPVGTFGGGMFGKYAFTVAQVPSGPHSVQGDGPFAAWLINSRPKSGVWSNLGAHP
ncbi:MAG: IgGFc-binding protein [Nannocystaceae bacterium]